MEDQENLENMATNRRTATSNICLISVLYILQGLNLGLTFSIPLFLIYHGATWTDQGTFNFALYPFSLKLIWAPLIDVLYNDRLGRRKSWLVPVQLGMAAILLLLSFYIQSFIATKRIILLTVLFFVIVLLTATQDISVDGLSVTLFSATNPQWASTTQFVGQKFGRFLGYSFLMTFESANFTNTYIRKPLSLPPQTSGLFTLEQFIRFVAVAFLVVSTCLLVFVREKRKELSINGEETNGLSLIQTYLSIITLLKKKCIRQLIFVLLLYPIGLVAISYMTQLTLISQGVPRENLALVNIPVILISMIAPIIIGHTRRPLIWFTRSYVLGLIIAFPIAAYIYLTPRIIFSGYYYPVLIFLLAFNEFSLVLGFAAHFGFFATISEPRIGGTYMTLLSTLNNLGFSLNSSVVLYVANWLPKQYTYIIAVGSSVILGFVWLGFSYRTLLRLQKLPACKWYLNEEVITNDVTTLEKQDQDEHQVPLNLEEEMNQKS